ncbi:EAL domain-containing protein [Rhizobium deserti]|uniref:EAL domain-containing protein n=1 Tax=Rhizobium deserti TaxID=2547961 RepID=A0A4R5UNI1_9HYPH|nr:EAL domain-containing protein [Rhizobium deserti]TDK39441.1 EAL domain-containing protein [Rhizobium deserti]
MKEVEARTVPTDVYLSFVTSLFGNRGTLFTGMVVHILSCAIIYANTESVFFLLLIVVFAAVFSYRLYGFHQFDLVDRALLTRKEIQNWEKRYVYGAALTAFLLGLASAYAVAVLQDMAAAFMCIAVTMASMVSIVGRNYGSARAVALQTVGCCLPIILGCFASGDVPLMLMSLLLIPFGLTTQAMATGVREFLYENVVASKEMVKIGDQLDIALNTTAHALVMVDADGQIQVINRRAFDLLDLDSRKGIKGSPFSTAVKESAGSLSDEILNKIASLPAGPAGKVLLRLDAARCLEFSVSYRADGGVVMIFEDVSARVAAEDKILHMVRYDSLTGLPNRGYFGECALARAQAAMPNGLAGLLILDVDGFKHVNDMQGHLVGDGLLAAIASRISSLAGDGMLVGRLVGDEFILLVTGGSDISDMEQRLRSIHVRVQGRYLFDGRELSVSLNGGCVILPTEDFDMEAWQIKADLALNDAKSSGNGTLTLFRPEMDELYVAEQSLMADLRLAIDNHDLMVVYQPMYRPDGSHMECCEALVRWAHPERGWIGPNIFIPMAEKMGLVSWITRFVLDRACRDCVAWSGLTAVSVNLSIADLRNDDLVAYVAEVLERHSLQPTRLHLEVTESCFMDEPVVISGVLNALRASGVTIAIDDFGTGFSSLSYLDSLPVDVLKIDRAFVTNITEDSRKLKLLNGIVQLSRGLGMKIVLEGVETREQLALINQHQFADLVQGYVFSRPIDTSEIARLSADQVSRKLSPSVRRRRKEAAARPVSVASR